ncbi:hypothetical protein JQC92_02110 [Shewanella sp. 202IG2-18]|uniref:lipase family alpha/beta hydrolase n=1 Tax=Parashewanella hymeniacidonis TaxID=2807618 RepID=UPI0019619463|nr:hypothetical protein [Parashewanella hymeniacidonis]MBM7070834.1 hypothetical protein [Parashewanella hymeniacidonis]
MKKIFVTFTFLVVLFGCSDNRPNLKALYHIDDMKLPFTEDGYIQPPVVIVPGLGGSTLKTPDGQIVWPGSTTSIIFSDYNDLALMIDDDTLHSGMSKLQPHSLISEALGVDVYGSLMNVLENYADFEHAEVGDTYSGQGRRYYLFPYDWRQNIFRTAKKLDEFIDQIREDYDDPNLEVDLIAHSQGGLVSRYYLKYGVTEVHKQDEPVVTQDGAKKVRRLIQLGSPNLGATSSLIHFISGLQILSGKFSPLSIATLPSIYELLPHPSVSWAADIHGKPLNIDLYDPKTWERFQWGIYSPELNQQLFDDADSPAEAKKHLQILKAYFAMHLHRAKAFHLSLSKPFENPEYSIIAFGGNCNPTPARIVFENINGKLVSRLTQDEIERPLSNVNYKRIMLEPGDGVVTKPSLLARDYLNPNIPRMKDNFFPLDYAFFLCNPHRGLTGDVNFQDNLLNELLER